jgi:hypothetical protein
MVLNISGINKLIGNTIHTRTIGKVFIAERYGNGSTSYVFHFTPIPNSKRNPSGLKSWEDDFEIHLYRTPKNNRYELFWMGLHGVTCTELSWNDIQTLPTFTAALGMVVGRGKRYWAENK